MLNRDRLIVALDVPSATQARQIVQSIGEFASTYKIGKQLFTAEGPQIVRDLVASGRKVFLDLKFHDIPNTVAAAVREAAKLNVTMLTVKPIPANYSGDQWLPVNKLQLAEKWSADPSTFMVGEPITRTLEESASGLTAAQLPALADSTTLDGFKLYPDQVQLTDDKNDAGISGKRVQKIAYIPTRAGNVTLPAIEVKWWDVATGKEQVTSLPAHTFTILPSKPSAATPPGDQLPEASVPTTNATWSGA